MIILVICISDKVFSLTIPDLNLNWLTQGDFVSCFGIYKNKKDYIIHGEMEISKINNKGILMWKFSGKDIFTTIDGKDDFKIFENYIMVKDFENNIYKLDFNGNEL
jgi:hypothetical protein